MEQHGVRARCHAARAVDALRATGAGGAEVQEHGAGGSGRQAAEKRLENRCADARSGRQGRGAFHPQDDQDRNGRIAVPDRLRHHGSRSGQFHDLDVRAQPEHAQAGRLCRDAGPPGAARAHVSPLQGVLERRALREAVLGARRARRSRLFHLHIDPNSATRQANMMNLYSGTTCPFSQRCRIVLYEKGMDFQIVDVDLFNKPEDLAVMNPYNQVPVLVERDLILYESNIINEYIDDRFPHPQLMPADPVMRARARLFLFRFEQEMFVHIETLEKGNQRIADKARAAIRDNLAQIAPVFAKQKYMLGDEFSMLDVAIVPLLWRLDYYDIQLPKQAAPVMK